MVRSLTSTQLDPKTNYAYGAAVARAHGGSKLIAKPSYSVLPFVAMLVGDY
jgi:hypothetical protein